MRLLLLTRSTLEHAQKGGMEVHAAQVAAGLARRGHQVEVLTTSHPQGHAERTLDGVPHHFLPGTPPGAYSAAWWEKSRAWVAERHAREPYDAALAESGAAEGVLAARLPRLPLVVVCHGISGWTLAGMWRGLGTTTTLAGVAKMSFTWLSEQLRFAFRTRQYDRVVCVSEPLAEACISQWHYARHRVTCVPNGIDAARFAAAAADGAGRAALRAELGLAPEDIAVLVSGRLEPDKGVHLALEAVARLALRVGTTGDPASGSGVHERLRLLIAGDGTARADLEAWTRDRSLSGRVRFLGHLPGDRLPALHAASDIHLFPTLLSESFGLGVLEAMAAARPVVAPLVGGIPMLLEDGATGLAFPVGDAEGIARAVERLAADPALRERLGLEGQHRAVRRFTTERMLDGYEQVLKEVAAVR